MHGDSFNDVYELQLVDLRGNHLDIFPEIERLVMVDVFLSSFENYVDY